MSEFSDAAPYQRRYPVQDDTAAIRGDDMANPVNRAALELMKGTYVGARMGADGGVAQGAILVYEKLVASGVLPDVHIEDSGKPLGLKADYGPAKK
jgi:hypothetical protein